MSGILYGVSVGPGDPELMTLKAVKTIEKCEVVAVPRSSGVADTVAFGIARQAVPGISEKRIIELDMPMTRDKAELERIRQNAEDALATLLSEGKNVAFLTIGDVSIYSTYSYIHERIVKRGFSAEMIPGVPSFCAVAAKLGCALTEEGKPLHVIPASYSGIEDALGWSGAKVLMKSGKSLPAVIEQLKERGLYDSAQMVERCGLSGERVFHSLDGALGTENYLTTIIVREAEEKE